MRLSREEGRAVLSFQMIVFSRYMGLPWWYSGEESTCQGRGRGFTPWVGKIPWRRAWQPTPVFLPGEAHGQRSQAGCRPRGRKESRRTERIAHTSSTPRTGLAGSHGSSISVSKCLRSLHTVPHRAVPVYSLASSAGGLPLKEVTVWPEAWFP